MDAQQAQVDLAQINLGYTKVRSLIDGIAGIASEGRSAILRIGPTLDILTTTGFAARPGHRCFISRSAKTSTSKFARPISKLAMGLPSPQEPKAAVQLILSDGSTYSKPGKLYLWPTVAGGSSDSGTIRIAALFPNGGGISPAMQQFGRVRIQTQVVSNALLVPQAAVRRNSGNVSNRRLRRRK